jgi:hypothetical protein
MYCLSKKDILHVRAKTTMITETRFSIGQLSIHMVDVAGQLLERKKWIHNFKSITSMLHMCAERVCPSQLHTACYHALRSGMQPHAHPHESEPLYCYCDL